MGREFPFKNEIVTTLKVRLFEYISISSRILPNPKYSRHIN